MTDQYVVVLSGPPVGPTEQLVSGLSQAFGMDALKAEALIRRLKAGKSVTSKPMAHSGALHAAERFAELGLHVDVNSVATPSAPLGSALTDPNAALDTETARRSGPLTSSARSARASVLEPPAPPVVEGTRASTVMASSHDSLIIAPDDAPTDGWGSGAPETWPPVAPADPWAASAPDPWGVTASTASRAEIARPADPLATTPSAIGAAKVEPGAGAADPWATTEPDAIPEALWEPEAPTVASRPTGRRVSLRSKFLAAAILPTVLAVAAAIGAITFTVPGALRTLLLESARNPASAMADGIAAFASAATLSPADATRLQTQLDATRLDYQGKNVAFMLVTDVAGNPLAGWYKSEPKLQSMPSDVRTYTQTQARRAVAEQFMKANNYPVGTENPPSRLVDAGGQTLEVAAQPISRSGAALGAVIVGMTSQTVQNRVLGTVTNTLLASLLPIILAFLLAGWLARSITQGVVALVRSADRISLGDFEAPIEMRTNDELRELGEALERMRTSLQESLERLRRRRH